MASLGINVKQGLAIRCDLCTNCRRNEVQKEGKLDSFKDVSFNLGHLVVAGGGKIAAFAEDPSIPSGARPPNGDGGPVHNIHPSPSVPLVAPFPLSVLLPAPSPLLVPFPLSFLLPAPSPS